MECSNKQGEKNLYCVPSIACPLELCWQGQGWESGRGSRVLLNFQAMVQYFYCVTNLVSNGLIPPWHLPQENRQFPVHTEHKVALLQLSLCFEIFPGSDIIQPWFSTWEMSAKMQSTARYILFGRFG